MNKKIFCCLLTMLLLCTGVVFAGGQQEPPEAGSEPATVEKQSDAADPIEDKPEWLIENTPEYITLIDAVDREVTINKPVKSIVQNHMAVAETINIIGAWDMVIGIQTEVISPVLFPGLDEMTNCVTSNNPFDIDYEKVFELEPDLFLTAHTGVNRDGEIAEKLEPSIPVVVLVNASKPDSFDKSVKMLGAILDMQEKAEEYITWADSIKNQINERIISLPEADLPRVFKKGSGWTVEQLCTSSNEVSFNKCLFERAGGINIANGLPSKGGFVGNVDPEWMVEQDYDILVVQIWNSLYPGSFGYDVNNDTVIREIRKTIMTSELFAGSNAVKNNKVYLYDSELDCTHRYIIGMAYWAKWFHPELFTDMDPRTIHQEYLRKFMNVDLDLNTSGLMVYPEE